jgi:uncharacterized repeat protein (TIGR03803 family)
MKKILLILSLQVFSLLLVNIAFSQTFLYGVTTGGGTSDGGTIYRVKPDGTSYSVLYNFNAEIYGVGPGFTEFVEYNGKLYGITPFSTGEGILYEFNPSTGVLTSKLKLTPFGLIFPNGTLTLINGKMYGMTNGGGGVNKGALFEYDPVNNTITTRVTFTGMNGARPYGSLTEYDGKLYGITSEGGANGGTDGYGVLFEYNPQTDVFTKKKDFEGSAFVTKPIGNLVVHNGKFYGVTNNQWFSNFGCIYEYDPVSNNISQKVVFNYQSNGTTPRGNLSILNGKIYGMLGYGNLPNSQGALYEYNPSSNILTNVVDFNNVNMGYEPDGKVLAYNNKLYGMTHSGGTGSGARGTLFEFDPVNSVFTKKIDFVGAANGEYPNGSLMAYNNKMYGITSFGGLANAGTLFEYSSINNILTKKIDFNYSPNGYKPVGGLILHNQKLYGTSSRGGAKDNGTLFEFDPTNNTFNTKASFDGCTPNGYLTVFNSKIYGLTSNGGSYGGGVLYEYDLTTNILQGKSNFNQHYPTGGLTLYNNKLYGLTKEGGGNNGGMLFEYNPANGFVTQKKYFDFSTGSAPYRNLTVFDNKLYGMTYQGGINLGGTIFEYNPLTDVLTHKINLSYSNTGNKPKGNLTVFDNKLYGTTGEGGLNGQGTLFEYIPSSNTFTKKNDFTFSSGSITGNFTIYKNQLFGAPSTFNGYGGIYRYDPVSTSIFYRYNFTNSVYPSGDLALIVKEVDIAPSTPQTKCMGEQLTLNALSNGFTPTNYSWSSSPASSSFTSSVANPVFTTPTVNSQTVYTLTVTASDASNTVASTIAVTVNPNSIPTITSDSPTKCPNGSITLQSSVANSYQWFVNNSAIVPGNNQNITVNQLGDYKVSTMNSFGCIATSSIFPVTLTPNPVANFTFTTLQRTATFTNVSTNSLFYSWSFGDNSTSNLTNPVKQYLNNGSYNVILRSTSECGVFNELTKQVVVSYCDPNAFETKQSGNWNDLSTWDCGQVPSITDVVVVKTGHTIYIPSGYSAYVKKMILLGRIAYDSNSQLMFGN